MDLNTAKIYGKLGELTLNVFEEIKNSKGILPFGLIYSKYGDHESCYLESSQDLTPSLVISQLQKNDVRLNISPEISVKHSVDFKDKLTNIINAEISKHQGILNLPYPVNGDFSDGIYSLTFLEKKPIVSPSKRGYDLSQRPESKIILTDFEKEFGNGKDNLSAEYRTGNLLLRAKVKSSKELPPNLGKMIEYLKGIDYRIS